MSLATTLAIARVAAATGVLGPLGPPRPDRTLRMAHALLRHGSTLPGLHTATAARFPDRAALVDERGVLTHDDLRRRSNALADALAARGVAPGEGVALLCRNHRGWVDAMLAAGKLGAHVLLLNTGFAGPQLADVLARERPRALIFDEEFAPLLDPARDELLCVRAWCEGDPGEDETLEALIAEGDPADPPAPAEPGRAVILTSGTTGSPKGAARGGSMAIDSAVGLLERIPLRARAVTQIAAPLFHAWGYAHFALATALAGTVVLRRRFDPEAALELLAVHRVEQLVVVPVMLQRILALDEAVLDRYDTHALHLVAASGSHLPGALSEAWMDRFGETLHSLYGSTEVAFAAIAAPEDLRAAPGTAGFPPRGTVLRLYDPDGRRIQAAHEVGRIFVGSALSFEGYTGGGDKDRIDGLLASGDVGHLDAAGRLFVDGRDDDMIVSGGENVFPLEVEELLAAHPDVDEVAVVGVDDDGFGQRLRAVVVPRAGAELAEDDLRAHVKANLAGYKVPRDVLFVDELPRNETGKVLKRDLV